MRNVLLADRKSTRLNSSHANISYAVFCLKKKRFPRFHYYGLVSFHGSRFRFGKTSAQFAEDLSKLENPLLAGKPPRRAQGAARKAFTAPRRVPQRDGIVRRIETDFMRSGMCPGAICRQRERSVIAGSADFLGKFLQR